jgi:hypothetical protein
LRYVWPNILAEPFIHKLTRDLLLQVWLALLVIGPWAAVLIYDLLLYIWRSTLYEIPVVGGRARGKEHPRAPSLTEHPGGETRTLGIPLTPAAVSGTDSSHKD